MGFATIPVRQAVSLGIPRQACLDYARSLLYRAREEKYAAYGQVADNQEFLDEIFEDEITATEDDLVDIVVAKAVGLGNRVVQVLCLADESYPQTQIKDAETAAILLGLTAALEKGGTAFVVINDCKDAVRAVRLLLGSQRNLVRWQRRGKTRQAHNLTLDQAKTVLPIAGYDAAVTEDDYGSIEVEHRFASANGYPHESLGDWAREGIRQLLPLLPMPA